MLVFIRPIYSGKAFEKKIVKKESSLQQFVRITSNRLQKMKVVPVMFLLFSVRLKTLRTIIKEVVRKATEGVDLIRSESSRCWWTWCEKRGRFRAIKELAEVLGGAVGASRGHVMQTTAIIPYKLGKRVKLLHLIYILHAVFPGQSNI